MKTNLGQFIVALIVLFVTLSKVSQAAEHVARQSNIGLKSMTFIDSQTNRILDSFIWFPTQTSTPSHFKINRVFSGFDAVKDAKIKGTNRPLIVLTHGTMGNKNNLH